MNLSNWSLEKVGGKWCVKGELVATGQYITTAPIEAIVNESELFPDVKTKDGKQFLLLNRTVTEYEQLKKATAENQAKGS